MDSAQPAKAPAPAAAAAATPQQSRRLREFYAEQEMILNMKKALLAAAADDAQRAKLEEDVENQRRWVAYGPARSTTPWRERRRA